MITIRGSCVLIFGKKIGFVITYYVCVGLNLFDDDVTYGVFMAFVMCAIKSLSR